MDSPIWSPPSSRLASARVAAFRDRVQEEWEVPLPSWDHLWTWSVSYPDRFWASVWTFLPVIAGELGTTVAEDLDRIEATRWFPGARLNFAENLLRHRGQDPVVSVTRAGEPDRTVRLSRDGLRARVAGLARDLAATGAGPGTRIRPPGGDSLAVMVTWMAASCLGATLVLEDPSGAEPVDTREDPAGQAAAPPEPTLLLGGTPLPFDHPLLEVRWGAGNRTVCGQGEVLLPLMAEHQLHLDLGRGDRVVVVAIPGDPIWLRAAVALASGASLHLLDPGPGGVDPEVVATLVDREQATALVAGPGVLAALSSHVGGLPGGQALPSLRVVVADGGPLPGAAAEGLAGALAGHPHPAWRWSPPGMLASLASAVPIGPVHADEFQSRSLGMHVDAFDALGNSVWGGTGELVVKAPAPGLGSCRNQAGGSAGFDRHPEVWCSGIRGGITPRGGLRLEPEEETSGRPRDLA